MVKHFIECIIFVILWSLTCSGMESIGVESRQMYMLAGGLFGVAWMSFLMLSED